ncbi:MAG: MerR family transcriptional regulator, partial [Solobacterium sp.]|nr:MerR family transcriptional regulator [Solobacterium sp.]
MKINQVEELTGITRKNIRFYEEEGLISPKRNPANGYREYSLQDVDHLNRIRL